MWQYVLLGYLLLAGSAAGAQTPCQGGTASSPACSRNWATAPLSVLACPESTGTSAGTRVVVREVSGTPLLSANAATPGGTVSIPTASAPLAQPSAPTRTLEFYCEDSAGRKGASTYGSITFPVVAAPVAPTLQ